MDLISNAWWPCAKKTEPLAAVRITADCLEQGCIVPPDAAAIVAHAFRQYLAGHHDITGNLGLRPSRGGAHAVPIRAERRARRDACIKGLYNAQVGNKTVRAQKVVELLKSPPAAGVITEVDVLAHLNSLYQEFGEELPASPRQIMRLVDGKA